MQRIYKTKKISKPLSQYKNASKGINYNWNCFQKPFKENQKKILIREQGGICAYCMQKIEIKSIKIEHIKPQHCCRESEKLSHKNMLAVCQGTSDANTHCDTFRGELSPEKQIMQINPLIKKHKYRQNVIFKNGELEYKGNKIINNEISEKLNLNCSSLVEKRQKTEQGYIEALQVRNFDGSLKSCKKELLRLTQRKIPFKRRKYDDFCTLKISVIKERISYIKKL